MQWWFWNKFSQTSPFQRTPLFRLAANFSRSCNGRLISPAMRETGVLLYDLLTTTHFLRRQWLNINDKVLPVNTIAERTIPGTVMHRTIFAVLCPGMSVNRGWLSCSSRNLLIAGTSSDETTIQTKKRQTQNTGLITRAIIEPTPSQRTKINWTQQEFIFDLLTIS